MPQKRRYCLPCEYTSSSSTIWLIASINNYCQHTCNVFNLYLLKELLLVVVVTGWFLSGMVETERSYANCQNFLPQSRRYHSGEMNYETLSPPLRWFPSWFSEALRYESYAKYIYNILLYFVNGSLLQSHDGEMLAVASSYTFEEGEKDHPPDQIYLVSTHNYDFKPKLK